MGQKTRYTAQYNGQRGIAQHYRTRRHYTARYIGQKRRYTVQYTGQKRFIQHNIMAKQGIT